MTKKLAFAVAALAATLTTAAYADTYTYTYTGNHFTGAQAPFTTSDSITGSFVTAAPLGDNFNGNITPLSFSFSDGVDTIANTSQNLSDPHFFQLTTDESGAIVDWEIALQTAVQGDPTTFAASITTSGELNSQDVVVRYEGGGDVGAQNVRDPGQWTETVNATPAATPEPSSFALLGTGLLGFAGVVRKRFAR